jgi:hypothetical protein
MIILASRMARLIGQLPLLSISRKMGVEGKAGVDWQEVLDGAELREPSIGWIRNLELLYVIQLLSLFRTKTDDQAVFTTQMLPGRCPPIANAKKAIEKAIYDVIG